MAGNESIIEVIQKMVQEGQPREKIIQTIKSLGVDEEQAKKLLLIAEADTFTLLKREIGFLVKDEFAGRQKDFEEIIHKDLAKIEDDERVKIKQLAMGELSSAQDAIMKDAKSFENNINTAITSSDRTVSLVKVALDSLNSRIQKMELDVEQLKVHKFRKKSMVFSFAMLACGAAILIVSLYLMYLNFVNIDGSQMLLIGIMLIASITLMFAAIVS